eukprot:TRINITY_DN32777_c0_g1_i1.p1 TRINITY_DN32777_c0_g1~~TRINITY_DN32777_c0_g1_i1.p1  ORF type:complete len:397 (+),score=77.30 TRINITY_DN32777_c0_g1_i1:218-1408(+)
MTGGDDFQRHISALLDHPDSSFAAQLVHYVLIVAIVASTFTVILETIPEYSSNPIFFPLEMLINALFTLEFSLRLYASDSLSAFMSSCYNTIDFLAIFPGYVDVLILLYQSPGQRASSQLENVHKTNESMRTLRMIRMVRLVRVFRVMRVAKVARHSKLISILFAVFFKVSQSGLVVVTLLMFFLMVISASLLYLFESNVCDHTGMHCFGPTAFTSIPTSFWWAIGTLTTVGYGDMVPRTVPGRVVASLTSIAGVFIVAVGVAIVSINFREVFIEEKARADLRALRLQGNVERSNQMDRKLEEIEINEILTTFTKKSEALFCKLRLLTDPDKDALDASSRSNKTSASVDVSPMVDVLAEHSQALQDDVQLFITSVLKLQVHTDTMASQSFACTRSA